MCFKESARALRKIGRTAYWSSRRYWGWRSSTTRESRSGRSLKHLPLNTRTFYGNGGVGLKMNSIRRELNWRRKRYRLSLRPSPRPFPEGEGDPLKRNYPLPLGEGRVRVSIFDVIYCSCCFFWAMNSSIPFRLSLFLFCQSF